MNPKHLYLELRHDNTVEFGINSIYESKRELIFSAKPKVFEKIIGSVLEEYFSPENETNKNIIYHVHGFLGERVGYHTKTTKVYDEFLLKKDQTTNTIVSVIWHSKIGNYKKNWHYAKEVGQTLAPIIHKVSTISHSKAYKNHIFCHSMGNRIFEGISGSIDKHRILFDNIILTGADVEPEVFEPGKAFSDLEKLGRNIHVYTCPNDYMLKLSRFTHKKERVGLLEQTKDLLSYNFVDISEVLSHKISPIKVSNHQYHMNNITVLKDIEWQIRLSKKDSPYRIKLEDNRFLLVRRAGLGQRPF